MADTFDFIPTKIEWNEIHIKILQDLFLAFDRAGVRYVILKNDEGLPFENHSKDVDIVIEPGKYKLAAEIIRTVYRQNQVQYYKVHKFERLRCWYGFNVDIPFAIHIDLLEGFLHKGFEMFPFELIYQNAHKNVNGVYVLNSVFGNVILLLHSTICYHRIKEKYAQSIRNEYERNKICINDILYQLFDKRASSKLITLLSDNDFHGIEKLGRWFSHQSKKRIIIKRPFFTIYNVFDFLWEKVSRIILNLDRYNMFFTVHAPDGTGKTTFIKSLAEKLGYFYVCDPKDLCRIYHFRPLLLPNLGAVGEKAGVMKQDTNFTQPHRAKQANSVSSFIRMIYYWLDYVIGVPLILRKSAQFDKITIFDRYIYDFLVDPRRSRINLPYWLRRLFTRLVVQPRIVFVLDAPAEVIYKRKQELTPEEISRQLKEFRKLSLLGNRYCRLDATKSPEEIANDAIKIILDNFTKKL